MEASSIQGFLGNGSELLASAAPFLALMAFIFSLLAFVVFTHLERRLGRLTQGAGGTFEATVTQMGKEIKELNTFRTELEEYLKIAELRLRGSVQGMGIVRFNPFQGDGSGGNQSFSIALLDEFGNGAVISTLYARDRVGVYCKPLEHNSSQFELSEEEQQAVDRARKNIADHKKK